MAGFEALMNAKYQKITAGYKAEGDAFMAANSKKEGVITTPSGLQYIVSALLEKNLRDGHETYQK